MMMCVCVFARVKGEKVCAFPTKKTTNPKKNQHPKQEKSKKTSSANTSKAREVKIYKERIEKK